MLREALGDALRSTRRRRGRTLRDVAAAAQVSLAYLSEIERGQKEASSEILAAVCEALGVTMLHLLSVAAASYAPAAPAAAAEAPRPCETPVAIAA
nr:helix-turn-helix transcriptional regulator [Mumia flava]